MKIKRPTLALVLGLLVLTGAVSAAAGVYILFGLAWTLITAGCAAVAAGLLVDV